VRSLCAQVEDYMRSPLKIDAEKSLLKKLSIGALAVLGGGAFAYMAGPGLLVIGQFPFSEPWRIIHSSTHSLIHKSTYRLIHSSTHPLIHQSTHSLIHSSTHPPIHAQEPWRHST